MVTLVGCSQNSTSAEEHQHTHSYTERILALPMCEKTGVAIYECACGDNYRTTINGNGHNFSEEIIDRQPSCTENGIITSTCNSCGKRETISIDATGHFYGAWVQTVEPRCESRGTEQRYCDNCGHFETREVDELGHNYSECAVLVTPTESTTGILVKTCTNDATHKETFTLPKLSTSNGYTYAVVTAAKCESTGVGRYTYTKDGQTFNFDIMLTELEHNYGEWDINTNPTTTSEGELVAVCQTDASHIDTFVLPKLSTTNGYTYEIITPATNATNGLGRYTYVKENQTFIFDVVIASNTTEFDPR